MTSREPLPLCLVALCLGIAADKLLSVSPFVWVTLFLFLVVAWLLAIRSISFRAVVSRRAFSLSALVRLIGLWLRLRKPQAQSRTQQQLQVLSPRQSERQSSQNDAIENSEKRHLTVSTLILTTIIAAAGGLWHHLYWNVYPANDPGLFQLDQPTPVVLEGRVITSPRWIPAPPDVPGRFMQPSDRTVLTLRVTQLRNGLQWEPAAGRISVSVTGKLPDVHYGDHLRLVGKLSRPNQRQNPGDYDQATMQRQQRVLSLLRVDDAESVTKLKSGSFSMGRQLERLRLGAKANIERHMSPEHASFAAAMILGVRDEITPELSQMMLESGIAHIISISGLHVGLISLGFAFLLRLLGLRHKPFALVLALMILCYLCITDMCPAAIRATLLVFVACLSIFRGQRRLQVNAFAATGIVVLIINPTNLFQIGAQLSFIATSVFLWFDRQFDVFGNLFGNLFERDKVRGLSSAQDKELAIDEMTTRESLLLERQWFRVISSGLYGFCRRGVNELANTFLVSVAIWLVVSPLIATQMHVFSPVAVFINPLLWVPLMLVLLTGFGVMITGWFCPPLAALIGIFADWSYAFLTNMIAWFHAAPYGFFWVPGFCDWWLVVFYVVLLVLGIFPVLRPKKRRWLVIAVMCWLLVAFGVHYARQWDDQRNNRMYVRVLSVGHGLCVHVKTPEGQSFLYDVGSLSSPFISANVAANSIWDLGGRKLDAVIISHPDSDHYNGLSILLEKFRPDTVYVTPHMFRKENAALEATHKALTDRNIPIVERSAGDTIDRYKDISISVLHPPAPNSSQPLPDPESNAGSMVVLVEHLGHRVLLPGDVESNVTPDFLRETPVHVDVMLAPHHGSIKKTADELAAWAAPDYIVISGGLFTYRPESKPHFEQSGHTVFETLNSGMVEFVIDRNGVRVHTWR